MREKKFENCARILSIIKIFDKKKSVYNKRDEYLFSKSNF